MTLPEFPTTPYGTVCFVLFLVGQALFLNWRRQAWRQHEADKLKWAELMARTDDEGRRALINSRPPEPPPNLLVVALLLATGALVSLGASVARGEHQIVASSTEAPKKGKGLPKPPSNKCPAGCSGTEPNCKCPSRSERPTQISGIPTSILGEAHPWMAEPIEAFPPRAL